MSSSSRPEPGPRRASDGGLVAGLDLGSTGIKVLVVDATGQEVLVRQQPTPWRAGPGGTTELDADRLHEAVVALLHDATEGLAASAWAGHPVAALAISGMGETGLLIDSDGSAAAPAYAWFDPRGGDEVASLPAWVQEEFAARTGLPLGAQVTLAKLLHLRATGVALGGRTWTNLPEHVATTMGARPVTELSLGSRTGLLDQDTGLAWPELLAHLGVGPEFLPELVDAGTPLGRATAAWVPGPFADALLTVAGHDHLVSAVSGGAIPGDRYHVSTGTAEVLLRVLDAPVPPEARARLAGALVNCVRHVEPGKHVVVAGVKTGLLMRRALQLAGIADREGRDRLDALATAMPLAGTLPADAVDVRGARNDDGVLSLVVRADGVGPAELFNAVLRHGNDEIALLVAALDEVVPPARSTLLTGGWADMASVRRARAEVLPDLVPSTRAQDTAYGATLFARRLLEPSGPHDLHDPSSDHRVGHPEGALG